MTSLAKYGLLCVDFIGVVMIVIPSEKKRKFRVVFLFGLRHVLELRTIACHKLGQFIDDIPQFLIIGGLWEIHTCRQNTIAMRMTNKLAWFGI